MDRGAHDALRRLLDALGERFRITRAILFGSRARGEPRPGSDIDLILVSPDFAGLMFPFRASEVLRYWEGDSDLEVLCYTPGEYERLRGMMGVVAAAEREGEVLVGKRWSGGERPTP